MLPTLVVLAVLASPSLFTRKGSRRYALAPAALVGAQWLAFVLGNAVTS